MGSSGRCQLPRKGDSRRTGVTDPGTCDAGPAASGGRAMRVVALAGRRRPAGPGQLFGIRIAMRARVTSSNELVVLEQGRGRSLARTRLPFRLARGFPLMHPAARGHVCSHVFIAR